MSEPETSSTRSSKTKMNKIEGELIEVIGPEGHFFCIDGHHLTEIVGEQLEPKRWSKNLIGEQIIGYGRVRIEAL